MKNQQSASPVPAKQSRKGLIFGACLVLVVFLTVALIFRNNSRKAPPAQVATIAPAEAPHSSGPAHQVFVPHHSASVTAEADTQAQPVAEAVPAPEPNRDPKEVTAEIASIGGTTGTVTKEQATKYKQDLATLVSQGSRSVPAIRDLLAQNVDTSYNQLQGGDQLSYSSMRAGLLDTLNEIGGADAQAALLQTLQTTAMPDEILAISQYLEQQSPGAYREQIVNAAQEAVRMAEAHQLGDNVEVGPAFRVLQQYGGAGSAITTPDSAAVGNTPPPPAPAK